MCNFDYRFSPEGSFALTVDGEIVGDVYERRHAEMIAEMSNKKERKRLEEQVERYEKRELELETDIRAKEKEIDSLKQTMDNYKMTLQKIHQVSNYFDTGDSTAPAAKLKKIRTLSSIVKASHA